MTYSIIGMLASIILLIINRDVLWRGDGSAPSPIRRNYRLFLMGVMGYYVTDMLWGILDQHRLTALLYADTAVHFVAMAAAVMLWTRYAVSYLDEKDAFGTALRSAGSLFFLFSAAAVAVNFFHPVLFRFDEGGNYHAGPARHLMLAMQILLFLLTSFRTLFFTAGAAGAAKRRHMTVGLFGSAMALLIAVQVFHPLLPFYAMGYMLGTCVLHSFIVEDEKDEYRRDLERALERERQRQAELDENRKELQMALGAAEHASMAKTAFLSNMSHEIRTPMNAIIGLTNIAINDPTASGPVKGYLGKIGSSARHLLGIINDILDMSRIESGRMTVKNEEFSFAAELEQVNAMIGGQCGEKGVSYDCQVRGRVDDYYFGDAMKLKQVMLNILGNAVKFTPAGGTVRFIIEEGPRFDGKAVLKLVISDTGIGMSKEFLPHVFEPFSQEDSSLKSRYGSTGLGMPITKSMVELMNGSISVDSEKGRGTTFTVSLTLGESGRKTGGTGEADLDPGGMSVLVIDDDEIALDHARIVLGQIGISCDTAGSGWEGVDKVRVRHGRRAGYDLILIDWRMPEMDGLETTRQIRAIAGDETPIIILTSFNWDDIADDARNAGVDTIVSKPLFAGSVMDEFRAAFMRRNAKLARRTADLKGRRVLLAEDMPVNAEIMVMVLSMREIDVDLAENGKVAVDLFAGHEEGYYDAILMDMRMPEMDGLEATRVIRGMDRADAASIPIVALTANAFDEDVQRSMQAGLDAHLSKPVEPEVLFETLESLIKD